jgi:hypothetical protein
MGENGLRVEDLRFGSRNGFVFVDVARDQAGALQQLLGGLGIGSSVHLAPGDGPAVVHPRTNLSAVRVRDLVAGVGPQKL